MVVADSERLFIRLPGHGQEISWGKTIILTTYHSFKPKGVVYSHFGTLHGTVSVM